MEKHNFIFLLVNIGFDRTHYSSINQTEDFRLQSPCFFEYLLQPHETNIAFLLQLVICSFQVNLESIVTPKYFVDPVYFKTPPKGIQPRMFWLFFVTERTDQLFVNEFLVSLSDTNYCISLLYSFIIVAYSIFLYLRGTTKVKIKLLLVDC